MHPASLRRFSLAEKTKSEDIHSPILDTAVIIKESSKTNQRRAEGWAPGRALGAKNVPSPKLSGLFPAK
jgi:hypothetical protein